MWSSVYLSGNTSMKPAFIRSYKDINDDVKK